MLPYLSDISNFMLQLLRLVKIAIAALLNIWQISLIAVISIKNHHVCCQLYVGSFF